MKICKKPDLNAPRFRPKILNVLNREFYSNLITKHPHLSKYSYKELKTLIKNFNKEIWKTVIDKREGVDLPEQLGYIFIGSCSKKKKPNVDFKATNEYGFRVQNRNWESDDYLAKIFYTNFERKYKFKYHELWGFTADREFKRTLASRYPVEWKKYVLVDNIIKVSSLFRKNRIVEKRAEQNQQLLNFYDEFEID